MERGVDEWASLTMEPLAFTGYREVMARDADDDSERRFVIFLQFTARWIAGEPKLDVELSEWRWVDPAEVAACRQRRARRDRAIAVERLKAAG